MITFRASFAKYRVSKNLEFILLDGNDRFFEFFGKAGRTWIIPYSAAMSCGIRKFSGSQRGTSGWKTRSFYRTDEWLVRKNNAWLQINASCIACQDSDPIYLVIYIDITNETELRQMQCRLKEQAKQLRFCAGRGKKKPIGRSLTFFPA